jgi:CheY-like chemotaxis protein
MHKILIVDDMRRFLDLEKSFLKRAECRILTALTGLEAIKVAKTEMPDIIMLDVEMPEMNGIEATRILKNDPQTKHIPIVIFTALDNIESQARKAGCDDFHRKPMDEDKFLRVVQAFVPLKIRKYVRAVLDAPALLKEDGKEFKGQCVNISATGVFIKSAYRPVVGTLLEVQFPLPLKGEERHITSLVYAVRQGSDGMGYAFYDLSTGAELYIREFLKESAGPAE